VESECTSHNFSLFAIFLPKNYQNCWKFDKVLTETILHSFFETRCI